MKKSMLLFLVLAVVWSAEENQDKQTRIITHSDKTIFVDPNVEKAAIEGKDKAVILQSEVVDGVQQNESSTQAVNKEIASKTPNKEQATSLEYNLQPVENTEGTIVINTQTNNKFHINSVNTDAESIAKEGAVSLETYLEGLEAKEQATSLEYNLQPSNNTEGEIKNNPKASV